MKLSVAADNLPNMTFIQACFLFFSAWLSGVLNSVAGGGGLIIFPALLLTGLSPINANATSTLASAKADETTYQSFMSNLISIYAF